MGPLPVSLAGKTILVYGPSISGPPNEATLATAAGAIVTVDDLATWSARSTASFASFDAIVFGDRTCSTNDATVAGANGNKATWSPAVTGNVYVQGTDPRYHIFSKPEAATMMTSGMDFAANGGGTGLYASLSCYYYNAPIGGVPVPFLDNIGAFTVEGQFSCPDQVHIVDPAHPAMAGLTDAGLSNWGCSAHDFFIGFPASMVPLAEARRPWDGQVLPYIIASSAADFGKELTSGPDRDGDGEIDLVTPVGTLAPVVYDFTITFGDDPDYPDNLVILDTIPAEWDQTDVAGDLICSIFPAGKSGKSATKIECRDPGHGEATTLWATTRCHAKNGKCRPTSCGGLWLNDGAELWEYDPATMELVGDEPVDTTDGICFAAVEDVNGDGTFTWDGSGDEDGDGLSDYDEACVLGTDPCIFTTCVGLQDVCIDADGIATAGRGLPGAGEVWVGQPLTSWPTGFWIEGIDWFDNDSTCTWTFGDDLHLEDSAGACTTGIRNAFHEVGFDCDVLDLDGSFFTGQRVDVDLETGSTFTGCPGVDPLLKFYDSLIVNGFWDNGEDIVIDANNNGVFD